MSRLNASIIPERLKEARMARGLTMAELAEQLEVSRQSISKYELGISAPSGEILAGLINILDFPLSFFTKPVSKGTLIRSVIHFRSLQSATKRSRVMVSTRSEWMQVIYHYLAQFIDFPKINIPEIPEIDPNKPLDMDYIEDIALRTRKHWGLGLGPISNVCLLLEKNGFIVTRAYLNQEKLDACSYWDKKRPFIFLGSDKESAVRSRLDEGHELGHLIMHIWLDEELQKNKEIFDRTEREAFRFAGAFLLPRDSFGREVFSSSLEHFEVLKKRWRVSMAAMINRCEDLGILSDSQLLYLRKQMSIKRYRKQEPLDDVFEPEKPSLLSQALQLLVSQGVKTKAEILDDLNLPPDEIEALCNLEPEYFSEDGKIIPLKFK